jgi:hypothetical protein
MGVLTDLASAEIKITTKKLFEVTLTRPAILVSDGLSVTYACDVNIGATDPTGAIRQYIMENDPDYDPDDSLITGLPGQPPEDWQLDDSLPGHVDTTMHNVVISRNNSDLIYADVGSPVVCERNESGQWQITGFSIEQPGTHKLYPVNLGLGTIGTIIDLSVDTRLLTLAEIGEMQPFGVLPFGASAVFRGGELLSVV